MRTHKKISILALGALSAALIAGGAGLAHAQYTTNISASAMPYLTSSLGFLSSSSDLSVGSRGDSVVGVQGLLSELGYLTIPTGVAPGYFGNLTRNALVTYQQSLGLTPTGIVDVATKDAIKRYLSLNYPSVALAINAYNANSVSTTPGSTNANAAIQSSIAVGQMVPTQSPLGQTGYWYNGNWYGSLPHAATTTVDSSITGYWYNGIWYPTNTANIGGNQSFDVNTGYWYNGNWYSTTGSNPNTAVQPTSQPMTGSANLTPTGYWYNGNWYASVPSSNSGIAGYWQNNVWQSFDGKTITVYGTPNPTTPGSSNGYWYNGVWYSTNPSGISR